MNKLHEAKIKAAKAMIIRDDFKEAAAKRYMLANPGKTSGPLGPWLDADKRTLSEVDRAYTHVEDELASDFDLRVNMLPWMVDFMGFEEPGDRGLEILKQARAQFGELPQIVRAWLEKGGWDISDSGGGPGGWHLGVHCSSAGLDRLTLAAYDNLKLYIEARVLVLRVHFWGWKFDELPNAVAARMWLAKHGVS